MYLYFCHPTLSVIVLRASCVLDIQKNYTDTHSYRPTGHEATHWSDPATDMVP